MSHHQNLTRIKAVAQALDDLLPHCFFVGGATIGLYLPQAREAEVRPTIDIDIVVEISTYSSRIKLEDKLKEKGFQQDNESGITCRYEVQGIIVDIMSTKKESWGFTNLWYQPGSKATIKINVLETTISILPIHYLFATKLEALKGRGGLDYRTSHDMEDIVYLLAFGKEELWEAEIADVKLIEYIGHEAKLLLSRPNIREEIESHLTSESSAYFTQAVLQKLAAMANDR